MQDSNYELEGGCSVCHKAAIMYDDNEPCFVMLNGEGYRLHRRKCLEEWRMWPLLYLPQKPDHVAALLNWFDGNRGYKAQHFIDYEKEDLTLGDEDA